MLVKCHGGGHFFNKKNKFASHFVQQVLPTWDTEGCVTTLIPGAFDLLFSNDVKWCC